MTAQVQYDFGFFGFLGRGGFRGRTVAETMVVGGVISTGASASQHCRLCWSDVQCETGPSMYPYLIVFNRIYLIIFVSKLVKCFM